MLPPPAVGTVLLGQNRVDLCSRRSETSGTSAQEQSREGTISERGSFLLPLRSHRVAGCLFRSSLQAELWRPWASESFSGYYKTFRAEKISSVYFSDTAKASLHPFLPSHGTGRKRVSHIALAPHPHSTHTHPFFFFLETSYLLPSLSVSLREGEPAFTFERLPKLLNVTWVCLLGNRKGWEGLPSHLGASGRDRPFLAKTNWVGESPWPQKVLPDESHLIIAIVTRGCFFSNDLYKLYCQMLV